MSSEEIKDILLETSNEELLSLAGQACTLGADDLKKEILSFMEIYK